MSTAHPEPTANHVVMSARCVRACSSFTFGHAPTSSFQLVMLHR